MCISRVFILYNYTRKYTDHTINVSKFKRVIHGNGTIKRKCFIYVAA